MTRLAVACANRGALARVGFAVRCAPVWCFGAPGRRAALPGTRMVKGRRMRRGGLRPGCLRPPQALGIVRFGVPRRSDNRQWTWAAYHASGALLLTYACLALTICFTFLIVLLVTLGAATGADFLDFGAVVCVPFSLLSFGSYGVAGVCGLLFTGLCAAFWRERQGVGFAALLACVSWFLSPFGGLLALLGSLELTISTESEFQVPETKGMLYLLTGTFFTLLSAFAFENWGARAISIISKSARDRRDVTVRVRRTRARLEVCMATAALGLLMLGTTEYLLSGTIDERVVQWLAVMSLLVCGAGFCWALSGPIRTMQRLRADLRGAARKRGMPLTNGRSALIGKPPRAPAPTPARSL